MNIEMIPPAVRDDIEDQSLEVLDGREGTGSGPFPELRSCRALRQCRHVDVGASTASVPVDADKRHHPDTEPLAGLGTLLCQIQESEIESG